MRVIEIEGVEKFDGLSGWAGTMPIVIVKKEEDDKKEEKTERKRFTVLHELGHLVLNIAEGVEDKAVEKLCNQFANEVLLPESAVRKDWAIRAIRCSVCMNWSNCRNNTASLSMP